jgi:hypothetical protein
METYSMRRALWLTCLLLPLGGCYVDQPAPGYGYAPPGYPPPPPPPSYDPYAGAYPGYGYNGGAPVYYDAGVAVPLVVFGGAWGYYDHDHHWHRAPEGISRDLEVRRAGGGPYPPGPAPHPEPYPQQRPGQPGPAAYHPGEPPHPVAPPRPASGAPPHQEGQEHHRDCPPGQRC